MFWADSGWFYPDPASTRFLLNVFESPLPDGKGFSAHVSTRRRPAPDQAPTDAKAAALYANAGRALKEAHDKGFENAVMLDPIGNVAEFATANLFMAKDGVVHTPAPNGTFLNGITRSEEHTSELQSLKRNSYAVFCLKKQTANKRTQIQLAKLHT